MIEPNRITAGDRCYALQSAQEESLDASVAGTSGPQAIVALFCVGDWTNARN